MPSTCCRDLAWLSERERTGAGRRCPNAPRIVRGADHRIRQSIRRIDRDRTDHLSLVLKRLTIAQSVLLKEHACMNDGALEIGKRHTVLRARRLRCPGTNDAAEQPPKGFHAVLRLD